MFGENSYSLSGQFNSFDLPINVQQSTLENSNLSSSPTSSLDSFKQFDSLNNASLHQPNNKAKLPSVRNSGLVNLNQCVNKSNTKKNLICIFCKNNGESEEIFKSHALKDLSGKVTCPLLMCHQCPVCGATGQNAHTLKYCKKFINSKRIAFLNGEKWILTYQNQSKLYSN